LFASSPSLSPLRLSLSILSLSLNTYSYDRIPSVSDAYTLTGILRGELDYNYRVGYSATRVPSTWLGAPARWHRHGNRRQIIVCLLPSFHIWFTNTSQSNFKRIPSLVKDGRLDIKTVDQAVSRLLRAKFEMRLFENPSPAASQDQWPSLLHTDEATDLACTIDRGLIMLLENHSTLLKKTNKIAIIGPMAHGYMNVSTEKPDPVSLLTLLSQYGDYVVKRSQNRGVTPLGIRAAVGEPARITNAQ
jgi:beta-glucosidase